MLKVEYLLKISRMSDVHMPISGPLFSTSTELIPAQSRHKLQRYRSPHYQNDWNIHDLSVLA
jgi:hypothetical protein